jgi:hypothetical protein
MEVINALNGILQLLQNQAKAQAALAAATPISKSAN